MQSNHSVFRFKNNIGFNTTFYTQIGIKTSNKSLARAIELVMLLFAFVFKNEKRNY